MAPKKRVPRGSENPARGRDRPRPPPRSERRSDPMASRPWSSASSTTQRPRAMRGTVVPVDITIYEDRTFSFVLKTSPTPVLLRQAAGVAKGSATTSREQVGTITEAQLARHRPGETEGSQHDRPRSGQEAGRRNRAFHGDQGRRLSDRTTGERRWPSTARSIEKHWPRSTGRRSTASPKRSTS